MTNPPPLPQATAVAVVTPARSSLWPLVVLLLGFATIAAIAVYVMPPDRLDHAIDKIGSGISWFVDDPAGAVATVASLAGAVVTVLVLLHIQPPKWLVAIVSLGRPKSVASEARPTRTDGSISLGVLLAILIATAAGVFLGGCGSAIHTHAVTAHTAYQLVRDADPAIVAGTSTALAQCPHDDGDARSSCIDRVEHVAVIAGSARDLLIPAVEAYRAATLRACDIDPTIDNPPIPESCPDDTPTTLTLIEAAAEPVEHDLPILTSAIAALNAGGR